MRKFYFAALTVLVISLAFTACGQKSKDVTKPNISVVTSVIEKTEVVHDTSVAFETVTDRAGKAETVTSIVDVTRIEAVTEIVTEVNSEKNEKASKQSTANNTESVSRRSDETVIFTNSAGKTVIPPKKAGDTTSSGAVIIKPSNAGTSVPAHSFPETPSLTVNQSGSSCPQLLSLSEPASRGDGLSIVIMGKSNTEYTLTSDFNGSGEGTETSNAAGIAGWSIIVSKSCSVGTHKITVKDNSGNTLTVSVYIS